MLLFSKLNKVFCGYFDPEYIFLDNEKKEFSGWTNRCFGENGSTARNAPGGVTQGCPRWGGAEWRDWSKWQAVLINAGLKSTGYQQLVRSTKVAYLLQTISGRILYSHTRWTWGVCSSAHVGMRIDRVGILSTDSLHRRWWSGVIHIALASPLWGVNRGRRSPSGVRFAFRACSSSNQWFCFPN